MFLLSFRMRRDGGTLFLSSNFRTSSAVMSESTGLLIEGKVRETMPLGGAQCSCKLFQMKRWSMARIGWKLWTGTAGACLLSIVLCGASAAQQDEAAQGYRVKRVVSGMLQLPPLTEPLKLEEPNRIPLILYGGGVHSAFMTLSPLAENGDPGPQYAAGPVTVQYDGSGRAYVEVTPERVGSVQVRIAVYFNNGDMEAEDVDGSVVYPSRRPAKIEVIDGPGGDIGTVYLGLSHGPMEVRDAGLFPRALYAGAQHPAPIPYEDVKFTVISNTPGDPPISLDDTTGQVEPRHLGHALVMTTFQGLVALTCIDVRMQSEYGNDLTVCQELVPPGMTAPPHAYFTDREAMPQ